LVFQARHRRPGASGFFLSAADRRGDAALRQPPALLAVFTAAACADFFLYDPIYSFVISSRVEFGDLTCFSLLALITVKCASELFRPSEKIPAAKSRYGRP
jgi:hypothetical protein